MTQIVTAMNNLLQKTYNCYISYLNNLNFGKVNQKYDLLYGSIIFLKSGITDAKVIEYFESNLNCNG